MRSIVILTIAALLGGCSGVGGSLDSYLGVQAKADCNSATPEELAADEAQPRPLCAPAQERHNPNGS